MYKFSKFVLLAIVFVCPAISYSGWQWEINGLFSRPSLNERLSNAVFSGDLDEIRILIAEEAYVNYGISVPIIFEAIAQANYSLSQNQSDSNIRLEVIKLLIQTSPKINEIACDNDTALEFAISRENSEVEIIRLLIGYGANITQKVLRMAQSKSNSEKLMRILDEHNMLLNEVESNPTEELLRVTILYDKPYVVQLIVEQKPELVSLSDIELAKTTSPASLPILNKGLMIAKQFEKFRELAPNALPIELVQHIKKFVAYNE